MMQGWRLWLAAVLVGAGIAGAIYLPGLRRRMREAARIQQKSAEQARQELAAPITSGGEARVKAKLFWASSEDHGTLAPVMVDLPLSDDPVLRAKQVLNTLLAGRNRDRRFFRSARHFPSIRNTKRTIGGGFDYANLGGECASNPTAENFDTWAGDGVFGRTRGSDRFVSGEQ